MVGNIFNLTTVNPVPCIFTANLSPDSEYMTRSLAYIESIIDATVIYCKLKTISCIESEKYHYNKFFSPFVSLCSLLISAECTLNVVLIFKKSGFQIILTKLLPHAHFRFRIFNPITLSGTSFLTCTENVKTYNLGYLHILQSKQLHQL